MLSDLISICCLTKDFESKKKRIAHTHTHTNILSNRAFSVFWSSKKKLSCIKLMFVDFNRTETKQFPSIDALLKFTQWIADLIRKQKTIRLANKAPRKVNINDQWKYLKIQQHRSQNIWTVFCDYVWCDNNGMNLDHVLWSSFVLLFLYLYSHPLVLRTSAKCIWMEKLFCKIFQITPSHSSDSMWYTFDFLFYFSLFPFVIEVLKMKLEQIESAWPGVYELARTTYAFVF